MRYFVTLFDSNYLSRGLTMYRSLENALKDFHLWIVCFDDLAYDLLVRLELAKATPVALADFEDPELVAIKPTRSPVEYCWTCTPSVALYVLNRYPSVDMITYIDADLMFFSTPEPIFEELGDQAVLITEHRYLPEFDSSATSGTYNVQFVTFRRDECGLEALEWWRERCIEWCFYRVEDNKLGDQKYLDDWLTRFKKVHSLQHLGGGLAPWNAAKYSFSFEEDEKALWVNQYPLIFYHFHALRLYPYRMGYACPGYPIPTEVQRYIYRPYFKAIRQSYRELQKLSPGFALGILENPPFSFKPSELLGDLKNILREKKENRYYIY